VCSSPAGTRTRPVTRRCTGSAWRGCQDGQEAGDEAFEHEAISSGDRYTVFADLDLGLVPLSTGRRWLAARRPELYATLTRQHGNERDPHAARFTTEPVEIDLSSLG
jgi:hypothetical protein